MNLITSGRQFVKKFTSVFILVAIILAVTIQFSVFAQSSNPPTDDEVNAIAKELYCPVCENTPLDVCPTQACAQWRDLIREKLIAGWNSDQIKQYFVNQYGDRVLAQPPREGLNWLVYILPPLFFLGGIYLVYRNLRTVKITRSTMPVVQIDDEDPYLKEIEEALRIIENKDHQV